MWKHSFWNRAVVCRNFKNLLTWSNKELEAFVRPYKYRKKDMIESQVWLKEEWNHLQVGLHNQNLGQKVVQP